MSQFHYPHRLHEVPTPASTPYLQNQNHPQEQAIPSPLRGGVQYDHNFSSPTRDWHLNHNPPSLLDHQPGGDRAPYYGYYPPYGNPPSHSLSTTMSYAPSPRFTAPPFLADAQPFYDRSFARAHVASPEIRADQFRTTARFPFSTIEYNAFRGASTPSHYPALVELPLHNDMSIQSSNRVDHVASGSYQLQGAMQQNGVQQTPRPEERSTNLSLFPWQARQASTKDFVTNNTQVATEIAISHDDTSEVINPTISLPVFELTA